MVIAREAITVFGVCASGIMQGRSDNHTLDGDSEGAEVWQRVTEAVRELLARC